jgi:predicted membrane protein
MTNRIEARTRAEVVEERSLPEIIQAILKDVESIIQAELRLARREIREKVGRLKNASIFIGVAALLGILGAACLVTACIAAIAVALPLWLSALIMWAVCCVLAGIGFVLAKSRLEQIDPVPHQTIQTVKENVEWAKQRAS